MGRKSNLLDGLANWSRRLLYRILRSVRRAIRLEAYISASGVHTITHLLPLELCTQLPAGTVLFPGKVRGIYHQTQSNINLLTAHQTLYIYLGIAALVGIGLGLTISFVYDSLRKPLGLDETQESRASRERTAKQYRTDKRKRKAKAEAPLMTAGYLSPSHLSLSDGARRARSKGLLSQTIMEEVDSDY